MKILRKIKKIGYLILRRPRGFSNYCLGLLSALVRSRKALGLPVHVTIEPTNICNLRCPVCETGSGILNRSKSMMKLEDFKTIIDKICKDVNSIFFYHMGEPFLNPDSYKMIRYAKDKDIYITSCTNGHFIDAMQLLDSGIDEISFQISGLSNETHQKYRIGSQLDEILKNLKELLYTREKLKKSSPKIILGLIVMKHNESEIDRFYELAKTIGVDEARIFNPRVRTWEQAEQFMPRDLRYWMYSKEDFDKGRLELKGNSPNRCNWIYISAVISVNGDIVPCCRDFNGNFVMGNILKDDLQKIWNGPKYRLFRKNIAAGKENVSICEMCNGFEIPGLYEGSLKK